MFSLYCGRLYMQLFVLFLVGEAMSWHISDHWSPKHFINASGNRTLLVYVVYFLKVLPFKFHLFLPIKLWNSFYGIPLKDRTHFKHFLLDMKCTLSIQGNSTSASFVLHVTGSIFRLQTCIMT